MIRRNSPPGAASTGSDRGHLAKSCPDPAPPNLKENGAPPVSHCIAEILADGSAIENGRSAGVAEHAHKIRPWRRGILKGCGPESWNIRSDEDASPARGYPAGPR